MKKHKKLIRQFYKEILSISSNTGEPVLHKSP